MLLVALYVVLVFGMICAVLPIAVSQRQRRLEEQDERFQLMQSAENELRRRDGLQVIHTDIPGGPPVNLVQAVKKRRWLFLALMALMVGRADGAMLDYTAYGLGPQLNSYRPLDVLAMWLGMMVISACLGFLVKLLNPDEFRIELMDEVERGLWGRNGQ